MERLGEIADAANMASGSRTVVEATCLICERPFTCEQDVVIWAGEPRPIPVPTVCPECAKQAERAQALQAKEEWFARAMARYAAGHLGSRLARADLADFDRGTHNAAALEAALSWLEQDQPQPNLLIVGPVGSGKSYLAACMYNALRAALRPVCWLNAAALVAMIRDGFTDPVAAARAHYLRANAEEAPVLFLDDLGKVHPGKDVSWVEETFYGIAEARYRDELPTVVTTEWKAAALAERVGQSVVTRLAHGAWAVGIDAPPSPYRRTTEVPR